MEINIPTGQDILGDIAIYITDYNPFFKARIAGSGLRLALWVFRFLPGSPVYIAWQSTQTTSRLVFRLVFVFYVSHYMSYCRHRLMREYVLRLYDVKYNLCTVLMR